MIKINPHIIPTAITSVIIDHPMWGMKFIGWMGKATNHDYWDFTAPREPRETTGEADKKVGMGQ